MKTPKHKRMFTVRHLPADDYNGARCKITDTRNQKSVVHSWNYSLSGLENQALFIFEKLGIKIEGYSEPTGKGYICLFSSDFKTTLRNTDGIIKEDN